MVPTRSPCQPSIKDYVLVKQRLRPSVLDTRVYRGADLNSDHRLVIASLQLKVMRKKGCPRPGRTFEVELLKEMDRQADYMESIEKCFKDRKREGSVEKRWKELRHAIVGAAEEHLPRRRRKLKKWISDSTLGLIERKRLAFSRWQEHRVSKNRQREYTNLSKEVRRAVRGDKEKWLESW